VIHLWVRATLDYDDEERFRAQLRPKFAPRVALWDATFTMPYRLFRLRLREIARGSLREVRGATCSAWEDIPDGDLVLPVDDDDWFAPGVAEAVERAPEAIGYRWPSTFLEVPTSPAHGLGILRVRLLPWARHRLLCTTNNYALPKAAWSQPLLVSHMQASAWAVEQPPSVLHTIDERLSAMNRTLASQTQMGGARPSLGRGELVRKHRRYRRLYRRPPPAGLEWAAPHLAATAALFDELELRR
jgi:hypothetical protein